MTLFARPSINNRFVRPSRFERRLYENGGPNSSCTNGPNRFRVRAERKNRSENNGRADIFRFVHAPVSKSAKAFVTNEIPRGIRRRPASATCKRRRPGNAARPSKLSNTADVCFSAI